MDVQFLPCRVEVPGLQILLLLIYTYIYIYIILFPRNNLLVWKTETTLILIRREIIGMQRVEKTEKYRVLTFETSVISLKLLLFKLRSRAITHLLSKGWLNKNRTV